MLNGCSKDERHKIHPKWLAIWNNLLQPHDQESDSVDSLPFKICVALAALEALEARHRVLVGGIVVALEARYRASGRRHCSGIGGPVQSIGWAAS